jgi:hypothetical protein
MYLHLNADNPNQSRDVIVHFTERCAAPNDCQPVWTVWVGTNEQGEFDDQFEAMRFARGLADQHQLPAWLLGPDGQGVQRLGN